MWRMQKSIKTKIKDNYNLTAQIHPLLTFETTLFPIFFVYVYIFLHNCAVIYSFRSFLT